MTLPKYRCHKEVRAMKIVDIEECDDAWNCKLTGEDGAVMHVGHGYMVKFSPSIGGHFIEDNGFFGYSSAEAFEAGYTLIEEDSK